MYKIDDTDLNQTSEPTELDKEIQEKKRYEKIALFFITMAISLSVVKYLKPANRPIKNLPIFFTIISFGLANKSKNRKLLIFSFVVAFAIVLVPDIIDFISDLMNYFLG